MSAKNLFGAKHGDTVSEHRSWCVGKSVGSLLTGGVSDKLRKECHCAKFSSDTQTLRRNLAHPNLRTHSRFLGETLNPAGGVMQEKIP
jgi:hypothetical protein